MQSLLGFNDINKSSINPPLFIYSFRLSCTTLFLFSLWGMLFERLSILPFKVKSACTKDNNTREILVVVFEF